MTQIARAYRIAARKAIGEVNEVDPKATVRSLKDGAWVSAWVWVPRKDAKRAKPPKMTKADHTKIRGYVGHYCQTHKEAYK